MELAKMYIEDLVIAYNDGVPVALEPIERAKLIYKNLKEDEKTSTHNVPKYNEPEYYWAKYDLKRLGVDYKGLTKNQIYSKHQSEVINGIVKYLKGTTK